MKLLKSYPNSSISTLDQRRKILDRSSLAGNPAYHIRKRLQHDVEQSSRPFFARKLDDWSNLKVISILSLLAFGWLLPWAGTIDGAYQPIQVASDYEMTVAGGVASTRG